MEIIKCFPSISQKNYRGLLSLSLLLDAICQNDESNENSHGAIQEPDIRVVLEDFGADQNGESHNGTNHRVKPWKTQALFFLKKHLFILWALTEGVKSTVAVGVKVVVRVFWCEVVWGTYPAAAWSRVLYCCELYQQQDVFLPSVEVYAMFWTLWRFTLLSNSLFLWQNILLVHRNTDIIWMRESSTAGNTLTGDKLPVQLCIKRPELSH